MTGVMELCLLSEIIHVNNLVNAGHIESTQFISVIIIKNRKYSFIHYGHKN